MLGAQTRLRLSPAEAALIAAYADVFSTTVRTAYQKIGRGGLDRSDLTSWLKQQNLFTSHQSKSIAARVDQLFTTDQETLVWRISEMERRQESLKGKINQLDTWLTNHNPAAPTRSGAALPVKFTPPAGAAKIAQKTAERFQKNRRFCNQAQLLGQLKDQLRSGKIPRVFGSRPLLQQRSRLGDENSPWPDESSWRQEWERKRSGEIVLIGDGHASCGNGSAQLNLIEHTLTVRLTEPQAEARIRAEAARLGVAPDQVTGRMAFKQLTISNVSFAPGLEANLALAQQLGQPITVQLHRKLTPKGSRLRSQKKVVPESEIAWYVHAAFELPATPLITSRHQGVLGVDLNGWGLAWAICTPDGNLAKDGAEIHSRTGQSTKGQPTKRTTGRVLKGNIPLKLRHLSSEQAHARVLAAIRILVALAERYRVAIACENLDFSKLKSGLRERTAGYARMLSSLNTAGFAAALRSRCRKRGIPLHQANPAWTSIAGWAKYGMRNALSIDQAAAFAIARKALLGRHNDQPLPTHISSGPKAGQKLSPKFVRTLVARRELTVIQYHEAVRLAQPLPAHSQWSVGGPGGGTWRAVRKVLGSDRNKWRLPWQSPQKPPAQKAVDEPASQPPRTGRRTHADSVHRSGRCLTTPNRNPCGWPGVSCSLDRSTGQVNG